MQVFVQAHASFPSRPHYPPCAHTLWARCLRCHVCAFPAALCWRGFVLVLSRHSAAVLRGPIPESRQNCTAGGGKQNHGCSFRRWSGSILFSCNTAVVLAESTAPSLVVGLVISFLVRTLSCPVRRADPTLARGRASAPGRVAPAAGGHGNVQCAKCREEWTGSREGRARAAVGHGLRDLRMQSRARRSCAKAQAAVAVLRLGWIGAGFCAKPRVVPNTALLRWRWPHAAL